MFAKTSTTSSFLLFTSVLSRSIGLSLSGTSKSKSSSASSDAGFLSCKLSFTSAKTLGEFLVVPGADYALFCSPSPLKGKIGLGPELSPSSSFSSTSSMTEGVRSIAASRR